MGNTKTNQPLLPRFGSFRLFLFLKWFLKMSENVNSYENAKFCKIPLALPLFV